MKTTGVIGAAPRAEVHGNNLRHRAVHLFIFNRAGELLLQKRSRWKDRHPNLWDSSAAGHVGAGEEYDETAVRELREELGITAELTRLAKIPASAADGRGIYLALSRRVRRQAEAGARRDRRAWNISRSI